MKKVLFLSTYIYILLACAVTACKEDVQKPLNSSSGTPGKVSNIGIVNENGQATLTYTLPGNPDLAYVKAVYDLRSGVKREVKASQYTNTLVVDGFGDTLPHVITLYAVNKSEVASEPVAITVKPLENPIWAVYRNLKVLADFAGVRIISKNPVRANVSIIAMVDTTYEYVLLRGIYTSTDSINQPIRGLSIKATKLAVFVRDRFLNSTDTLFTTLTPLYEAALPKSNYKTMTPVIWPGDAPMTNSSSGTAGVGIPKIWDGDIINWPSCLAGTPTNLAPQSFTFDLGQLAQLSRIVIWDYPEYLNNGRIYYYRGCMKRFEVWGSANPATDGSWDSWTLLGEFTEVKPSGSAYGIQTTEDYDMAYAGFSWDFRIDVPKMRYLRVRCKENWVGTTFPMISEVQVYGDAR
ncbi:protein of unknown function [Filimonas lacunae]|uniref:F5/8 type C domain-containing protein n=1 Tax=Filimonas lacunae TaxID=477680 RepID=A0A173MP97_9BACT|nr:DUF5000 domain-containing lipoprotein [Filimonas lacunae]BAV09462.1 hypothetical protein FLA_5511 [Filimonas lacunae]SIS73616.1 protein of unknown function [Filimonas lacunae]